MSSDEDEYHLRWKAAGSVEEFGAWLLDAWSGRYLSSVPTATSDLVVADPGNGFQYLFDLAGSLGPEPAKWPPRVVGVWGRSQAGLTRDPARMRGHPRPGNTSDDRGHLIACAAGGGYDINLVPMDAGLNRGWSPDGCRFRSLERRAAAEPGSLFFVRLTYAGDTDRPKYLEVGVQAGDSLLIDRFANRSTATRPMDLGVLKRSTAFDIDPEAISGCLDIRNDQDRLFERAWKEGAAILSRAERSTIAGVTGHIAESVAEILLDGLGWHVLWHFAGPGRHGVDLVFLAPDDAVVAVEVKGTLVAGRIPRLSRRELAQMSTAWIDKSSNPGMVELGLQSQDVRGGVIAVNFADLTWRLALTSDFTTLHAVRAIEELASGRPN